jgi:hypothetical protein
MKKLMTTLIYLSIILSVPTYANNETIHGISLGGWSYHFVSETYKEYTDDEVYGKDYGLRNVEIKKYNQSHRLIGYFADYGDEYFQVGTFVNSYHKRSYFILRGFKFINHEKYYTGINFGAVSGYNDTEASNSIIMGVISLGAGIHLGKSVSFDLMLGVANVNANFRFNY